MEAASDSNSNDPKTQQEEEEEVNSSSINDQLINAEQGKTERIALRPLMINDNSRDCADAGHLPPGHQGLAPYLMRLRYDINTQIGLFRAILYYQELYSESPFKNATATSQFFGNWFEVDESPKAIVNVVRDLEMQYYRRTFSVGESLNAHKKEAFLLADKIWGSSSSSWSGLELKQKKRPDNDLKRNGKIIANSYERKINLACKQCRDVDGVDPNNFEAMRTATSRERGSEWCIEALSDISKWFLKAMYGAREWLFVVAGDGLEVASIVSEFGPWTCMWPFDDDNRPESMN